MGPWGEPKRKKENSYRLRQHWKESNLVQILLLMNICCSFVLDPGDKIVDCTFTMYEFDVVVNAIYFDIRF